MEGPADAPEGTARPPDPAQANDYDSSAEAYSAENENSLLNAYYERPAMLALAGDVTGRRILDAGCGSGPLSAALRDRGAVVTGIDASAGMLVLARRRLGDDTALHVVDLSDHLPFADGEFDDPAAGELFPDAFRDLATRTCFLFFVVEAAPWSGRYLPDTPSRAAPVRSCA